MGWTFMSEKPRSADAYFREQFGDRYTVLDSATVNLSEYYAATRHSVTGEVSCFVAMLRWERNAFGYKDMDERMGPVICGCPERILDLLTPLPECDHTEEHCRFCDAGIRRVTDGGWVRDAKPGQRAEVGGPRCSGGYRAAAKRGDGPPFHEPGGTAPCGTCWARAWRQRCRDTIAARSSRRRLLTQGSIVRLVGASGYSLPPDVAADPTFTVERAGQRVTFRHGYRHYRFPHSAQWESATPTQSASLGHPAHASTDHQENQ